jgi:acetylornithine/N-succinyldiaminopimelate aminotransferase
MKNIIWSTGHELKIDNIVDSDNCFLFDSNGKRFVDLESGVWCTNVGHNNKRVTNIISTQVNKIIHTGFCYCHPQIELTARKILDITGIKEGKCEFLCSGSEAVEFGMRIARVVSDKPRALTFSDSYFGAYGDAAQKSESSWQVYNWLDCACSRKKEGCIGDCVDFQKIPFHEIGIFLFEPGSSSGLVRFPSQELISKIIKKIRENRGIVIANEITTGIGRTGKWFGFQHYNFTPDIVAMGKGIGNGYPVSVTAISNEISAKLEQKKFLYAQSHQNDPLGAFVAYEVVSIIEEDNLLQQSQNKGEYLLGKLLQLKNENANIKDVRGRGLMIAIEMTNIAMYVYEELLRRGLIVAKRPNANVLRLDPALTIEYSTIDMFLDNFRNIMELNKSS